MSEKLQETIEEMDADSFADVRDLVGAEIERRDDKAARAGQMSEHEFFMWSQEEFRKAERARNG